MGLVWPAAIAKPFQHHPDTIEKPSKYKAKHGRNNIVSYTQGYFTVKK
jgi:hypothetical protein